MTTTIKSIKAEAAAQIKAIRMARDEAIQAIRQARIDAKQEQEQEQEQEAINAEYEARQAAFQSEIDANPLYKMVTDIVVKGGLKFFFSDISGSLDSLSLEERHHFDNDMKAFGKKVMFFEKDTEAYHISSKMCNVNIIVRDEEQRAEWRESHKTIWEKAGITLDLPDSQFQLLWDMYAPLQPIPDLLGDYGFNTPWDYEYLADIEPARKEAFIEWAYDLNDAFWSE